MRRRIAATVLAVLAAASAFAENPKGSDLPGSPAKSFPVAHVLNMRPARDPVQALRGRVLLVVFFDQWADASGAAVPFVNALHDRHGPRGLTVLWVASEAEKPAIEEWLKKHEVKSGAAIVDTETQEKVLLKEYPVPGKPWGYLIDAAGNAVWAGHPQGIQDDQIVRLLDAVSQPPVLPAALADAQKQLDEGTWSKAHATLTAAAASGTLSKTDAAWAKGTAKWIEIRRPRVLAEAEELEKKGWFWDAWSTWDDYGRRFEGMEGCDVAKTRADAVRANKDAAVDLLQGDDFAKARAFLAEGKKSPARAILERLSKLKSRFGERAKALLPAAAK